MPEETVTQAVARALVETGQVGAFAARLKAKRGWRCSDRAAYQRTLQLLNDGYSSVRNLAANDVPDALELAARNYVGPLLEAATERGCAVLRERENQALRLRVAELEEQLERPGMLKARTPLSRMKGVG